MQSWNRLDVGLMLWNSVYYAFGALAFQLVFDVAAAYSLSKLRPVLGNVVLFLMLATLMIPATVLVVPQYVTVASLPLLHWNLIGSPEAIWLPSVANAFNIFLLKRFFDSIPSDYIDAASVDGASPLMILWRIVLPISRPIIGVVSIFSLVAVWKDFLWPLLVEYGYTPTRETLNVGIWQASIGTPQNLLIAASAMAAVPTHRVLPHLPAQHHGRPHRGRHQRLTIHFRLSRRNRPASRPQLPHAGTSRSRESRVHRAHAVRTRAVRPPAARLAVPPGGTAPRSTSCTCAASPTATATASATWPARGRGCPTWPALGIDAIWFNPWYPSPMADAGYDISDYRSIDPVFGTLADADALIAEAHAHGIRIIIDVVPNHGSDQHPWFTEALAAAPGSAARGRFWFRPGRGASRRAAAEQLAVHLRRPRLDPGDRAGRVAGRVVPAPVRARAAGLQLGLRPTSGASSRTCCASGSRAASTASGSTRPRCCARTPTLPDVTGAEPPGPAHPYTDRDEVHDIYQSWRAIADEYGSDSPEGDYPGRDPRSGC